jgi:hypothetical protein
VDVRCNARLEASTSDARLAILWRIGHFLKFFFQIAQHKLVISGSGGQV